jgi:hypothetical protein
MDSRVRGNDSAGVSNCDRSQAIFSCFEGSQGVLSRTIALRMTRSLRMHATIATLGSLPLALSRAWNARMTLLCWIADSVACCPKTPLMG